jgi:hypothetical protein
MFSRLPYQPAAIARAKQPRSTSRDAHSTAIRNSHREHQGTCDRGVRQPSDDAIADPPFKAARSPSGRPQQFWQVETFEETIVLRDSALPGEIRPAARRRRRIKVVENLIARAAGV